MFFFFCFTEDVTALKVNKPKAEDDLNAEETSSEDEDELTQEGHTPYSQMADAREKTGT